MNSPDYGMQQQAEQERMAYELSLCARIGCGMTTRDDAEYVAASFGLLNEFHKEHQHEPV
jgi:hypothetical protein